MANIAISDITAKSTSLNAKDLLLVSKTEDNGTTYTSTKMEAQDLKLVIKNSIDGLKLDQIKFENDFLFCGNYTLGLKKTTPETNYTIPAGTTLLQALTDLFTDAGGGDIQPSITSQPSLSLTLRSDMISGEYEVGTEVISTYAVTLSPGSYSYGPETGVTIKTVTVTNNKTGETATATSGTLKYNVEVGSNTTYQVDAVASYDQGVVAHTSKGNPSSPEVRIPAGSRSATTSLPETLQLTGYYAFFQGYTDVAGRIPTPKDITSDQIRALTMGTTDPTPGPKKALVDDYVTPVGTLQQFFVIEKNICDAMLAGGKSFKLWNVSDESWCAVYGPYTKTVKDAGGRDTEYTLYFNKAAAPTAAENQYQIKIEE